jgi:hypothetical protein
MIINKWVGYTTLRTPQFEYELDLLLLGGEVSGGVFENTV